MNYVIDIRAEQGDLFVRYVDYVIDVRAEQGDLFVRYVDYVIDIRAEQGDVRYANFKETGPSVSVWMVPGAYRADQSGGRELVELPS